MIKWLDKNFEEFLLTLLLFLMTLIMGVQVFSRYIWGHSLTWSEELTRYLFIWSSFLSISYCTRRCISIKIEQFLHKFPYKDQIMLKIVNHFIEISLFIYLIPAAFLYVKAAVLSNQVSPALGIPMYMVQVAPLVGFLLVVFRIVQRIFIECSKLVNLQKGESK